MREILFRGRRLDNGEWIMSGNIIRFNPEKGEELIYIPGYNERCICVHDDNDNIVSWESATFYKVDPSTVGQYTGLTDKNGKRIFEGDICDRKEPYPEIVNYHEGDWTLDYSYAYGKECGDTFCNLGFYVCERSGVEVIGNIHDNPELLAKGMEIARRNK